MKKGDIFEGIIQKVEFPNKGIMMAGEERLVIKNTIPGQRIKAVVTKRRKGKCEGMALEILEKAPAERTEGVCPHFNQCGGCVYQSLPYEEQLKIKEEQVKGLLDSVCPEGSFEWQGLKPSPISGGYRNKMEFSFGDEFKGGPLALGMHKRGSFYDIVTTGDCRIVHPDFCRILTATKEYFTEHPAPFHKKLQHVGYLRHLLVRRAVKTGEILVDLVTTTQLDWMNGSGEKRGDGTVCGSGAECVNEEKSGSGAECGGEEKCSGGAEGSEAAVCGGRNQELLDREQQLLSGWKEAILALPLDGKLAGILHTQNDSLADVVQNDHTDVLYGQDYFYEELLGLRFKITPFSFFQTNSLGAEVLYETARSYIGETKDKVVFDLYSGTGTIAQILAPVAGKVVGVEIVKEAVEAAKENAARNGLTNCEFWAGDVLKVIDELEDKPDLIVLDPPRDGIHPKALPKIIQFGVNRIVYVSCKPTSLVRDLVTLQESGYRVVKGCAVDMFPGTTGIETV
ncbi:MAG: class I SAM-dependent RNA methyltransferase, partial [Lachnospiraceae bacterium]|nr:class I SAM-dependent RNA methyltransferase [Lachnospiraceae bacterium]